MQWVIFVGLQGSGKSAFSKHAFAEGFDQASRIRIEDGVFVVSPM